MFTDLNSTYSLTVTNRPRPTPHTLLFIQLARVHFNFKADYHSFTRCCLPPPPPRGMLQRSLKLVKMFDDVQSVLLERSSAINLLWSMSCKALFGALLMACVISTAACICRKSALTHNPSGYTFCFIKGTSRTVSMGHTQTAISENGPSNAHQFPLLP